MVVAQLQWWDDDDELEFDWLDGLMRSGADDVAPVTLLERLEEARPRWQRRAACRGHSDVSWFATEDRARAEAICAGCPVAGECREFGRREPAGIWGGEARGLRARRCPACGERPAHADLGLCRRCHQWRRRQEREARPRGRSVAVCADCGEEKTIFGRGLCPRCWHRDRRRRAGVQPRPRGRLVAVCVDCGDERAITSRGLCDRCYSRDWRRRLAGR